MADNGLTIPEAIRKLFDIEVASESLFLKNKAMSMVRNGLIKVAPRPKLEDHRYPVYLADSQQLIVLFNALLLNAVLHDPKDVKKVFVDKHHRRKCANLMQSIFEQRNSLMGITLNNPNTTAFMQALSGEFDLYTTKLPNPFSILPQLALGKNQSLLHALLVQSAALEPAESMLLSYLNGDLEKAGQLAASINEDNEALYQFKKFIKQKQCEADEFYELLQKFENM